MAAYTTLVTGPRREGESDGPERLHVVLLDNGRSGLLGTRFREVLRCIRCGACMNHCPVYGAVGGHAYGWGLSRPHRRRAHAGLGGVGGGAASAQRFEFLRSLRRSVPRA